jgi:hypothetical protein
MTARRRGTRQRVFPDLLNEKFGQAMPRVDPAPSFMYPDEAHGYSLTPVGDPNAAITSP